MDFRHLIVTCLFSMLRLSFETQKIKENYAIFQIKSVYFFTENITFCPLGVRYNIRNRCTDTIT